MVIAVKPKIVEQNYGTPTCTIQLKKKVNHGTTVICPNGRVLSHSFHDDVSDQCFLISRTPFSLIACPSLSFTDRFKLDAHHLPRSTAIANLSCYPHKI